MNWVLRTDFTFKRLKEPDKLLFIPLAEAQLNKMQFNQVQQKELNLQNNKSSQSFQTFTDLCMVAELMMCMCKEVTCRSIKPPWLTWNKTNTK